MKWPEYTLSALKKIKVPIVPLGVGFQCADNKLPILSEETKEVLHILSHSCSEIGVRGSFSAECLSELGIKNVTVIGCPSMYRKLEPKIKVDRTHPVSRIAFTLRREVSLHYSKDVGKYLSVQRKLIEQSLEQFETTVVCQGEVEEKIIFYNRPELERASDRIKNDFPMSEAIFSQYKKKLTFFDEIPEYEKFMISNDLTVGFRLHGNAIPLANGRNTVYITYDSRTREFVDTYKIPHYDIADPDFPTVGEIVENPLDFTDFEKNYEKMYSVFSKFLDRNGIDHRL
jgi:polysaccharide pyruvyl transferase WcaK-like protein